MRSPLVTAPLLALAGRHGAGPVCALLTTRMQDRFARPRAPAAPLAPQLPDDLVVESAVRGQSIPAMDRPLAADVGHPPAGLLDDDRRCRNVPAVRTDLD